MGKLIKFEKDGCVPCEMVSNYLDDKGVTYERINPFDNPDLAIKFGVMSVPVSAVVTGDGELIRKSEGYNPDELDQLTKLL